MISCATFRDTLHPGAEDAALLEHLRRCDSCLDYAVGIDPDFFFRAIGGGEMTPPGGVDAFVGDVMRQVQVRRTETAIEPRRVVSWRQRLAIAATLAVGVTGASLMYVHEMPHASMPQPIAQTARAAVRATPLTTKPIIEKYDSEDATIVEVPSDGSANVVMIFDDKLPADL